MRRWFPSILLLSCAHTAPHPPASAPWRLEYQRVEDTYRGKFCAWEEEALYRGDTRIWGDEPPDPGWCRDAVSADPITPEHARWFDVLGEDGRYLSVLQTTFNCCPERWEVACFTWDLEAGRPATLMEYDPELAEKRWAKAQKKWAKLATVEGAGPQPQLVKDQFVVDHGHIRFCMLDGDQLLFVPVR